MFDVVIKGGKVVDGTGAAARSADVAVQGGRIVELGAITGASKRTIDADGALVTPGFVDIHTHYDGQASWDETFSPSIFHGYTTVVMGNCGVGFAPVRKGDEGRLISLMEGVEEIPGAVLAEGVRWGWTTFPDYMAALDAMPHSLDFLTLVPHDTVRLFVMGDRAEARELATAEDRAAMQAMVRAGLQAGAIGFSAGRSDNHRTTKGEATPSAEADRLELMALAEAFHGLPYRVLHAVSDFHCMRGPPEGQRARFDAEWDLLLQLAKTAGRPIALSWMERLNAPQQWQWMAERAEASTAAGVPVRLQAAGRAIGLLNGLDTSFNALMAFPGYQEIAALPLPQRAAAMREPARRARILSETPVKLAGDGSAIPPLADQILSTISQTSMLMYPFDSGAGPDYEPDPRSSFGAQAKATGGSPLALIYDWLAAGEGENLVYFPIFNYLRGSLDTVHAMLSHPLALASLGDAGAHVGTVCDASVSTTLLSYFGRDRTRGAKLPVERVIELLTGRNAAHLGLTDRGTIAVGKRADLNVIDHANLAALPPKLVRDLPAGGKRFVQKARGYVATFVAGELVCDRGEITPARPGRLVRAAT